MWWDSVLALEGKFRQENVGGKKFHRSGISNRGGDKLEGTGYFFGGKREWPQQYVCGDEFSLEITSPSSLTSSCTVMPLLSLISL